MKRLSLFFLMTPLVIGGCSNETGSGASSPTAPLNDAVGSSRGESHTVSVKGAITTTFQFIPVICVNPSAGTVEPCSDPGVQPVVVSTPFTGSGVVSHLGRLSVSSSQTVDFSVPSGPTLTGTDVFTARNGDILNATHTGFSGFPDAAGNVTFNGVFVFAGGTGRFAGASGSVAFTGTGSLATGAGHFSLNGTLALEHRDDAPER